MPTAAHTAPWSARHGSPVASGSLPEEEELSKKEDPPPEPVPEQSVEEVSEPVLPVSPPYGLNVERVTASQLGLTTSFWSASTLSVPGPQLTESTTPSRA